MPLFLVPPSLGAARAAARAELLDSSLAADDIEVQVAPDYEALQRAVQHAEAELVWTPSAVCAALVDQPAARNIRAVLRAIRKGRAGYHSAIVARAGEGRTMHTLSGARVGWVDPLSAGGYLLAASYLRRQGIEPNLVFSEQRFLGSHRAVIDAITEGHIDVGAVSAPSTDLEEVQSAFRFYAGRSGFKLDVLGITESIPNDALLVTAAASVEEGERLAQLFAPVARRAPSFLLTAMEADRLERTTLDDYRGVRALIGGPRRSEAPRR
ncbi:MAG: PhnD/SsuA/transferrin family substrate-binding protein [Myxococcales bacterium]|nr:PhnD/SsuA/transferrin family substrate-binding protein [Myxococcales bacterium]